nr:unnamed protein product [Callosobruchus analis]
MASKMNVGDLLAHELAYEIRLRGFQIPDTVDGRRKVLRGLLAQDDGRSFSEVATSDYDFKDEFAEVAQSLDKVRELIVRFTGPSGSAEHRRISSRLTHIFYRIDHMSPSDAGERDQVGELKSRLLMLEADLQEALEVRSPPLFNHNRHQLQPLLILVMQGALQIWMPMSTSRRCQFINGALRNFLVRVQWLSF